MEQPILLRAVIVDDESLARARIRRLLQKDPEVQIVTECSNGPSAIEAVSAHHPDVLFLDVQMPGMDGFEVLERLPQDELPQIVFITAFSQYAVQAFESYALDYLLKPFNESRLQKAVARAKDRIRQKAVNELNVSLAGLLKEWKSRSRYPEQLAVRHDGRITLVRVSSIDWIEAESKYARLHAGRESYLLRESLTLLEERLSPKLFLRIHRSTIVNINRIKECHPLFHGDMRVILQDGTQLTLSRALRKRFDQMFPRA